MDSQTLVSFTFLGIVFVILGAHAMRHQDVTLDRGRTRYTGRAAVVIGRGYVLAGGLMVVSVWLRVPCLMIGTFFTLLAVMLVANSATESHL